MREEEGRLARSGGIGLHLCMQEDLSVTGQGE